ncbi:MAG: phosphate ABC transporter substrate-binding protein [Cyanobacteria bacterium J06614_10]
MKTPRWFTSLLAATALVCLTLPACTESSLGGGQLILSGSSTVAPLMTTIAERYQSEHPDVVIHIQTGGSNQGVADVRAGENDIGMISRSLKPDESDLTVFTIAQDGISILLNQSAAVDRLERQQIIDIFTGKIQNWRAVGGDDMPIQVLSKSTNHSTVGLFADYFGLAPEDIQQDHLVGDNAEILEIVLDNPAAIGYISIGAAEYKIIHGMPLKLLPLEGVEATVQEVSSGHFPLSRPLNLVTQEAPKGLAKDFIKYAQSAVVEDIVEEQAFVKPIALK